MADLLPNGPLEKVMICLHVYMLKIDYMASLLKNPPQMKEDGYSQTYASFCPAIYVRLLLNIQSI